MEKLKGKIAESEKTNESERRKDQRREQLLAFCLKF
jgi:hypothetical protein